MKPLQLPAQLTGISSKADNSYSIRISTQELSPEAVLELLNYKNQAGWICFAPNKLQDNDIPKEDAADGKNKSVSQRKRAVMYVWFKQNITDQNANFDIWYKEQMNKEIEEWKKLLE